MNNAAAMQNPNVSVNTVGQQGMYSAGVMQANNNIPMQDGSAATMNQQNIMQQNRVSH